jgi:hypothetical protein
MSTKDALLVLFLYSSRCLFLQIHKNLSTRNSNLQSNNSSTPVLECDTPYKPQMLRRNGVTEELQTVLWI